MSEMDSQQSFLLSQGGIKWSLFWWYTPTAFCRMKSTRYVRTCKKQQWSILHAWCRKEYLRLGLPGLKVKLLMSNWKSKTRNTSLPAEELTTTNAQEQWQQCRSYNARTQGIKFRGRIQRCPFHYRSLVQRAFRRRRGSVLVDWPSDLHRNRTRSQRTWWR